MCDWLCIPSLYSLLKTLCPSLAHTSPCSRNHHCPLSFSFTRKKRKRSGQNDRNSSSSYFFLPSRLWHLSWLDGRDKEKLKMSNAVFSKRLLLFACPWLEIKGFGFFLYYYYFILFCWVCCFPALATGTFPFLTRSLHIMPLLDCFPWLVSNSVVNFVLITFVIFVEGGLVALRFRENLLRDLIGLFFSCNFLMFFHSFFLIECLTLFSSYFLSCMLCVDCRVIWTPRNRAMKANSPHVTGPSMHILLAQ
jgi:hypothetical protein